MGLCISIFVFIIQNSNKNVDVLLMQNAAEKLPKLIPNWTLMYVVNAFVVVWVLVVGFGFGGWASMTHFIKQVDNFGLFAKCYQCPTKIPLSNHTAHH